MSSRPPFIQIVVNPFAAKGFPIDESVKSISALRASATVRGLNGEIVFDLLNHFTVIDQQLRVSMQNSLLYYCHNNESIGEINIYC